MEEKKNRILAHIVSPLFLAGGCFLWWFYTEALLFSFCGSYFWQEVPARVGEVSLKKSESDTRSGGHVRHVTLTSVQGSYSYEFSGKSYTGDRWLTMRGSSNMDEDVKKAVREDAEDGQINIRVNPKYPEKSVASSLFLPASGAVAGTLAVIFGLVGFGWLASFLGKSGGFILISAYFLFSGVTLGGGAVLSFLQTGASAGGVILFLLSLPCILALLKGRFPTEDATQSEA